MKKCCRKCLLCLLRVGSLKLAKMLHGGRNRGYPLFRLWPLNPGPASITSLLRSNCRHDDTARQLVHGPALASLQEDIHRAFDSLEELVRGIAILGELTPRTSDLIVSYGERLSSKLCTAASGGELPACFWCRWPVETTWPTEDSSPSSFLSSRLRPQPPSLDTHPEST